MNVCIIMGRILEEINFNFIYNNKYVSIANCKIEIAKETQIEIYGLDEKADYMYSKLNKNDTILVYGSIVNEGRTNKIEVKEIKKINSK